MNKDMKQFVDNCDSCHKSKIHKHLQPPPADIPIQLIHTTSYHPQCKGLVERLHRRIKASLTALGGNWLEELLWTLLGLRSVPCQDDGIFTAERVFGSSLVVPGSLLELEEASSTELAQAF